MLATYDKDGDGVLSKDETEDLMQENLFAEGLKVAYKSMYDAYGGAAPSLFDALQKDDDLENLSPEEIQAIIDLGIKVGFDIDDMAAGGYTADDLFDDWASGDVMTGDDLGCLIYNVPALGTYTILNKFGFRTDDGGYGMTRFNFERFIDDILSKNLGYGYDLDLFSPMYNPKKWEGTQSIYNQAGYNLWVDLNMA